MLRKQCCFVSIKQCCHGKLGVPHGQTLTYQGDLLCVFVSENMARTNRQPTTQIKGSCSILIRRAARSSRLSVSRGAVRSFFCLFVYAPTALVIPHSLRRGGIKVRHMRQMSSRTWDRSYQYPPFWADMYVILMVCAIYCRPCLLGEICMAHRSLLNGICIGHPLHSIP